MPLIDDIYVPAVKWRQGEYQALLRLTDPAKGRIFPLITIPDVEYDFDDGTPKHTVHEHVEKFPTRYKQKRKTRPAWIDVDVSVGRDTVIQPGTQLLGRTQIGGRCVIGPDTTLTDVTVGDNASVVRSHGESSVIGAGATVGPFSYLRPGTALGADGKLGAFVETKNSTIGTGTKVPHLTYVGDADIGEHSNIGASSVFVNYDGTTKRRTTIGSHVRTGSDTMFVAPVTVGDGAYTGAGTVVREDVPPGALAVSAGPQRNIEDWVQRKRPGTPAAQAADRAAERAARKTEEKSEPE